MIAFASDKVFCDECGAYIPDLEQISHAINRIAGSEVSSVLVTKDALIKALHENTMIVRIWESINTTNDVIDAINSENAKNIYPPLKNTFEHKALMGLLHCPKYREFWINELGRHFVLLERIIPKTWILKPEWIDSGTFSRLKQMKKKRQKICH